MSTQVSDSTIQEIWVWRRDQLLRAGFTLERATRIARDARYDLHALLELVDRGCPPGLAVRIVAPLEAEDRAA